MIKAVKSITILLISVLLASCGTNENKQSGLFKGKASGKIPAVIPVDKGFSEYISGYTSGIIQVNASIEIHFTPEFAAKADKSATGLFSFDPVVKGKTEWKDETTLVFTPTHLLGYGKIYTGELNMGRLGAVKDRLKKFPLRIQTLKKDFHVVPGILECHDNEGSSYIMQGKVVTADFIEPGEVESYITARLGRSRLDVKWDHSGNLVHKFTVNGIERSGSEQRLTISWDGSSAGAKQKGSYSVEIPQKGKFGILNIMNVPGESQRIDILFSDPVDPKQETEGLVTLKPASDISVNISSNTIRIFPVNRIMGKVSVNVEPSVRSIKGIALGSSFSRDFDFTSLPPAIKLEGKGVILPSSKNLIFPFKAVNLKSVDIRIIKIFDNNLPYFLQENNLNSYNGIKRFGRPVYRGKIDLVQGSAAEAGGWNMYTIDLSDYINIEQGVLYKVELGMRRSYSLYPCGEKGEVSKYEEALQQAENQDQSGWDDPENYYDDIADEVYYSFGFNWNESNDPCKDAYYGPDKRVSRNILASNLGLMAKEGDDNIIHVMVNDLLTAMPMNQVTIDVYDLQMQLIASGTTNQGGIAAIPCERKPFLVIAKKDKDRNYLKVNESSTLSLSSFDISGNTPENGIKAFICGERDVWRPGDSIYLSVFIKDMKSDLPEGHPVQFELINPQEQKIDNQVQKPDGSNLLVFATKTSPSAITGNYKAQFRIGGATFTKRIRVETVKPNRLKINLNFPSNILGGSNPVSRGTLNVKWLNGTVAKNLHSSVEYILKHTKTEFNKYSQYDFDDPVIEFHSESVNIFKDAVDENGNASVLFSPGRDINAPGMLDAVFTAKSSEPGGDESVVQTSYKYAPYPVFVGINLPGLQGKSRMLFTDTDNEVRLVTLDEKGNPVRSEVEVTVYKISYRWWWESDEENLASFISNNIYKPVIKKTLVSDAGGASFRFNIGKNDWGRYLIRAATPTGHSTGKILLVDWPWDYGMKGNAEAATLLSVNTNKEKYNPGEEVKLTFPSPENAYAIVTLENSTGIVDQIMTHTSKGSTVVGFRARHEMAPNVYAYVTVIQPHSQTINDMPIRLYGVVPVMVEDPDTRLVPKIVMADEIRSQKPFTVKVSESNRKPMTYTLAIVDEGLLDITGFKTPDPWKYFYAREALGVKTWDLYDFVLGAFGGTLERNFGIGGDEVVLDKTANKAKRFEPVVKFLGPFTLGSGKTNTHTITLPQYTGSVRAMVIAGNDRAFGTAEKSVVVKDPLMILVTAPRVISPGEKVALPVSVFVQKDGVREITLKAESNDLLRFDGKTKSISVSGTGEKYSEFTFVTGEKTGTAKIGITADANGESATYNMQIEVRSPNPPEIRSDTKIIRPGEKYSSSFAPFGVEDSNSALLEVSSFPSINLEKRLEYLIDYPHGCSEQITSAAFPQLWIKDLTGNDAAMAAKASSNVAEAITLLTSRQMVNGGIALWPNAYQPDNWVTSYAGHFIIEAERKGYNIPSGFRQKWLGYQRKTAQDWHFDAGHKQSANDQAYRLFTLALAGAPDKGAMNRMRETQGIPSLSKWLLAAAFAATGRDEVAGSLIDVRNMDTEREYDDYYYGSEIRDKAIILYVLTVLRKEVQALPVVKEICDRFNDSEWYSTQSVAWGLFSYMKWTGLISAGNKGPAKIKMSFNGNKSEQSVPDDQIWSKELRQIKGNNDLAVENTSAKPVYMTLTRRGVPVASDIQREDKGLSMKIDYVDMSMKPINKKELLQGTDFMMIARITNNTFTSVDNIALTEMVPSGWEIQNTRLFEGSYGIKESSFDYRDFRDDRVNTYFSLPSGQTKTFVLILTAAYKGEFYQPAIWCEAMYKSNCYSRFPGDHVKVTGQGVE